MCVSLVILLVLNVFGMLFSSLTDIVFERDPGEGRSVILFWSLYNVVVIAAAIAVCVETPRAHVVPRIPPEVVRVIRGRETVRAWIMRLTPDDAWVRGGPGTVAGQPVRVGIDEVGEIAATVTCIEPSGFAVALQPTAEQRVAVLRKLHTRQGNAGTQRTTFGPVAIGILRRFLRR